MVVLKLSSLAFVQPLIISLLLAVPDNSVELLFLTLNLCVLLKTFLADRLVSFDCYYALTSNNKNKAFSIQQTFCDSKVTCQETQYSYLYQDLC